MGVWSMFVLAGFQLMASLLLCQLLQEYIENDENDIEVRLWAYRYYGTSFRALYTMFEMTMSGCWPTYVRPIVEQVSVFYAIFFVLYISLVVFAVIRVISALFLKQTLCAAEADTVMVLEATRHKRAAYAAKIEELFREADTDGKGIVTWDDFNRLLSVDEVKTWLSALEIDVHEGRTLFHLLDRDGTGGISLRDFIEAIFEWQGGEQRSIVICGLGSASCARMAQHKSKKSVLRLNGRSQSKKKVIDMHACVIRQEVREFP